MPVSPRRGPTQSPRGTPSSVLGEQGVSKEEHDRPRETWMKRSDSVHDFLAETFSTVAPPAKSLRGHQGGLREQMTAPSSPTKALPRSERRRIATGAEVEVSFTICGERIHYTGKIAARRRTEDGVVYDVSLPDGGTVEGVKRSNLTVLSVPEAEAKRRPASASPSRSVTSSDATSSETSSRRARSVSGDRVKDRAQDRVEQTARPRRSQSAPESSSAGKSTSLLKKLLKRLPMRKKRTSVLSDVGLHHVDDGLWHAAHAAQTGTGHGEVLLSALPPPMKTIDFFADGGDGLVDDDDVADAGPTLSTPRAAKSKASPFPPCDDTSDSDSDENPIQEDAQQQRKESKHADCFKSLDTTRINATSDDDDDDDKGSDDKDSDDNKYYSVKQVDTTKEDRDTIPDDDKPEPRGQDLAPTGRRVVLECAV